jgi:succinoglycan biosynthesis protein ExoL
MKKIIMLVQDLYHSHTYKREKAFSVNNYSTMVYGFQRRNWHLVPENYKELGFYPDRKYLARLYIILKNAWKLNKVRGEIKRTDSIYAYNLDSLLLLRISMFGSSITPNVIYEVADIQKISLGKSFFSYAIRLLESYLLKTFVDLLVLTSDGYYQGYYQYLGVKKNNYYLWENKVNILNHHGYYKRQKISELPKRWIVAYVGNIRCKKSLSILLQLVKNEKITLHIHGIPSHLFISESYWHKTCEYTGVYYHGPFIYPNDLHSIYKKCHFVWSSELLEEEERNQWPISNRYYEAGISMTPQLSVNPKHNMSKMILANGIGLVIDSPYFKTLDVRLSRLTVKEYNSFITAYKNISSSMFSGSDDVRRIQKHLEAQK